MSEERFEVFGNIIKDNKDIPALLNNYQATVRLNEFNDKVKELKQDLEFTTKTANELIEIKHKLEQQLAEKDKELIYMTKQAKKFNNEAQKYYEDAYCNGLQNQKAIQKLEEVKMLIEWKFNSIVEVREYLQQQIKELKGEHDE